MVDPNFNIYQPILLVPLTLMLLTFFVFFLQFINLNYIKKKAYNGLFYFLIIMLVCVNLAYMGNYMFSKNGANKVQGQLNSGVVERKITELYGEQIKRLIRALSIVPAFLVGIMDFMIIQMQTFC